MRVIVPGAISYKGMTVAIAALFLMLFASAALSYEGLREGSEPLYQEQREGETAGEGTGKTEGPPAKAGTLQGRITAIDPQGLTLSSESGRPAMNIVINEDTAVKVCEKEKPFQDIRIGSNAEVKFHEMAGQAVAESVTVPC